MNSNLRTLRILLLMSALLLAGLATAILLRPAPSGPVQSMRLGGDFRLMSANGPVTLEELRGHPTVLYFGYASCPDVCPTSLAVMAQGFRRLSEDQQDQVRGIFISVDPQRDTPESLAAYTAFFHPRLLGLTGTAEELDQVTQRYGAYYRIMPQPDSALGYTVDHTSRLYLIDAAGQLSEVLSDAITPDELASKLKDLL